MSSRAHIPLKTKLAATLCQMLTPDEDGKLVLVIPYERAKTMTEDQILAVFHFDHDPIPKAEGGKDVHWNLTPRPVAEHQEKTAKRDIPAIAKAKRLRRAETEFHARMTAKVTGASPPEREPKPRIPSRPFPEGSRPMRSRPTLARSQSS